ncbi:unnamed protein product [Schistosoma margrebowiei]|uniref:Uncharacterized protein n=1 Tax=Schistosoma margrebowiei TaxID=48269 RepID=A0A3P8ITX3_9TREM|nr:unnamed protein product [Schistosoma margrebowiei]
MIDVPIIVSMYKLLLNELDKKLEEEVECDDEGNDSEFDDNDDNSDDDNEEVQAEGFEQQEELCVEDEIKSNDKNDQCVMRLLNICSSILIESYQQESLWIPLYYHPTHIL